MDHIKVLEAEIKCKKAELKALKKANRKKFGETSFGNACFKSLAVVTKPFATIHMGAIAQTANTEQKRIFKLLQDIENVKEKLEGEEATQEDLQEAARLVMEIESMTTGDKYNHNAEALRARINYFRKKDNTIKKFDNIVNDMEKQ